MLQASGQYVVNNEAAARSKKLKNLRVAQSYLCSIIPITASNTQYVMNVLDNQLNQGNATILPAEQRLKLQDVFFTSALGFHLVQLGWNGFPGTNIYQRYTFASDQLHGPLPNIPDTLGLSGVWGAGRLEVKVNGEVVTPYWKMIQHEVINQTQANGYANARPYFDQNNYSEDGYVITEPNWILNGGNNNLYTITYDNTWQYVLGSNNAGNLFNFGIAMTWDGWLAQNASSIMDTAPSHD